MRSRPHLFLLFTILAFFNPINLLWFKIPVGYDIIVPLTLLIWFIVRWTEIVKITDKSTNLEVLLGVGIYIFNITRNSLTPTGRPLFGLFDMFVAFLSVCITFYGLKGLKHFILPNAYLIVLFVGYQLELRITEVAFLENFLAQLITSTLNLLNITASTNSNIVTFRAANGENVSFLIDAACTGIKGMLAYGSLAILMILDVKSTNKRKVLCTSLGIVGTILVNILRLQAIFISGYLFGAEAALAVHFYLGYLLFIVWILLFWIISFKYLLHSPTEK